VLSIAGDGVDYNVRTDLCVNAGPVSVATRGRRTKGRWR